MVIGLILGFVYLASDFFYWAKYVASVIALRVWRKIHPRRFDLYNYDDEKRPEKLGVLIPEEETILESPFPDEHLQDAADEIFMYGVNSKGERLVVRVARALNDEAEAWIYLRLKDGRWYELLERGGHQRNFGGKCTSFTCGGLQMYHLSPMRRWRVSYCGMLVEGIKKGENKERKEVFVKFAFLWNASSDVFDHASDLDIRATADAMANAKWTSLIPPVHKVSEIMNFYCQSGVMFGTVSIEDEDDLEIYLFGERIRFTGKGSYSAGCRFKHIMGITPPNGLVLHLGKATIPNVFHNLHFGFMVHPDTFIRTIEDGIIISRMSGNTESKEELTAMFKAGKQYELRGNFVGDGVRFTSEQGWNGHLEMMGIEFEINGIKGSGFLMSGEILNHSERKSQRIPLTLPSARPLTVYFSDEVSHLTDLTGGKGSSLGKLTKLSREMESEFIVPKGIVVTTAAYKEFLAPDVINKIDKLKNIAYGNIEGNVQEACRLVMSAVENAKLPDKISKEIEEKLNKIFGGNIKDHKVAVRSSATGEDTDQMSAAGQMDTFLGVQGMKEILKAVKKCWASQFGHIATEYKRQNGQILNSPMAVVIQEMVECEAAGVLFTCDPLTNNPSVVVITGNYGLGESVVSGTEEPDTVVLKKLAKNEVEIKSVAIGMKQRRIVVKDTTVSEDEETVITEDVPEDKRNECCISQDIAVKLGKLSLKIEDYFKSPRDIEWGIKNNTIYMLQSRPITTGAAASDYEIKHEFDGPLRCEGDYYTVGHIAEVMPCATSPLGLDMMMKYFGCVFNLSVVIKNLVIVVENPTQAEKRTLDPKRPNHFRKNSIMKKRQNNTWMQTKYFPQGLAPFYNHLTMSVIDVITRSGDTDSIEAQSMMIALFGRILDDPELKVAAAYKEVEKRKPGISFYINLIKNLFSSLYGIEELKEEAFSYQVLAENGKTAEEAFNFLMNSCSDFIKPAMNHIVCSEMSSLWNMYMMTTLGKAKGCMDTDVYSDFAKLLATSSNLESADIPSALQKLAYRIVEDIKAEDFKAMTVEEAQKWLETSSSLAGSQYRQFIKRHGHRCLKEFDVYSVTWSRDPKPLIELLQNMAGASGEVREKEADDISKILPKLTVPISLKTKLLLKVLLPNCRRGVRDRENCKSVLIKTMDNFRKGFQHVSKMMVAEGYLPDTDLLYFLTINEIHSLLQTRNPRLIARASHRRKVFPTLNNYLFPEMFKGIPIPINENQDDEKTEYVADLTMKGIPVSQGSVKAYARVAISLQEAAHLKKGEILITYSTDIGWSPYFPILAGVVTELGGLISHGAVVSREYGLPCVVGLHGATKKFATGDYVLLDGNKGILQRLTPPEK